MTRAGSKALLAPQPPAGSQLADALLETQLNFVPACAKPLRRRHGGMPMPDQRQN